jgi:hypothetical protein
MVGFFDSGIGGRVGDQFIISHDMAPFAYHRVKKHGKTMQIVP